jgi:hypothetical protein
LILHPFADASGPGKLVESSRASLKLQGLLPTGESSREDLDRALLDGRFSELRMLFYVGKDLARWIDQCLEFAERNREALPVGTSFQSFAAMLVKDAPVNVQSKLRKWGVADYKAIFTRALGLHCLRAKFFQTNLYAAITATPIRYSPSSRASATSHQSPLPLATLSCSLPANIPECWNDLGKNPRTNTRAGPSTDSLMVAVRLRVTEPRA